MRSIRLLRSLRFVYVRLRGLLHRIFYYEPYQDGINARMRRLNLPVVSYAQREPVDKTETAIQREQRIDLDRRAEQAEMELEIRADEYLKQRR